VTAENIERIKQIKRAHENTWLAIKSVVAVGVGTTSSGKTGIIISVQEEAARVRAQIPDRIEDCEIEIRETGTLKAL
jgi:hypothetical protein